MRPPTPAVAARAVLALVGMAALFAGGVLAFAVFEVHVTGEQLLAALLAKEPGLAAEYESGEGDGMVQLGVEGISWFELDVRCGRPVTALGGGEVDDGHVRIGMPELEEEFGPDPGIPTTLGEFRIDSGDRIYSSVLAEEAGSACTRQGRFRFAGATGLVVTGVAGMWFGIARSTLKREQESEPSPPPPSPAPS